MSSKEDLPPREDLPSKVAAWAQRKLRLLGQPEPLVTLAVVCVCVGFVFWQFEPSKLFLNTTISGGDTGAHVLLPSVAEHQCLTHFRLTCWTSSNWDGFPAVTFYFPLPIYSIVALAQVLGYNVAFKLCTAAPMILMPVAVWLMGRIARAPFPIPAVLAIATVPYIFQTDFSIYGGNIASTLAGEFAFAWSLWFALVFFGFVIRGLQTGRYRAWAAVMLACCFMSQIDPAMFAGAGALTLILMYAVRSRDWVGAFWWAVPSFVVGGLLAAWWALPFGVRQIHDGLVTDMGYTRQHGFSRRCSRPRTSGCSSSEPWVPCFPFRADGEWGSSSPSWRSCAGWRSVISPKASCGTTGCCHFGSCASTCSAGWRWPNFTR